MFQYTYIYGLGNLNFLILMSYNFVFPNYLKMYTTFLAHRLYKYHWQVRFGL